MGLYQNVLGPSGPYQPGQTAQGVTPGVGSAPQAASMVPAQAAQCMPDSCSDDSATAASALPAKRVKRRSSSGSSSSDMASGARAGEFIGDQQA